MCRGITKSGNPCKHSSQTLTTQFCVIHKPRGEHIPNFVIEYPGCHYVNGGLMTKAMTQKRPSVNFSHLMLDIPDNSRIVLVMIDPDAPTSKINGNQYLHWLVTNIEECDVSNAKDIYPYQGPNPPPNSGVHRYQFYVLSQPGPITVSNTLERKDFNYHDFISKYGLEEVDRAFFTVSS